MDYVKRGLGEMGLGYKENTTITDWYGQKRAAALAVTKDGKLLPIGWIDNKGQFDLQADWFKVPYSEKQFTNQISQLHSKYQVLDICEDNRWNVNEDDISVNAQGEIEIMATSFS
jgi:hypothetical protein